MEFTDKLENLIIEQVNKICSKNEMVELPDNLIATDNLAEVIEKLVILHIRTWMLEDKVGVATDDSEVASLKKKIDICFKQKLLYSIFIFIPITLDSKSLNRKTFSSVKGS